MTTQDKTESWPLYKRLLGYARPYRFFFVICFFGFAVMAAMEVAMAQMMEYFVDGLTTRDKDMIIWIPIAVVAARMLHGIGAFAGNFFISRVGLGVVNDMRKQLFAHMLALPCSFYDAKNSGELVSLVIYNIAQVTGSVTNAVKIALRDGFTVVGLLIYLFYVEWKLTLIFLVMAPLLAGLVSIASRYFRRLSRRMQTTMGDITHVTNEALQGYKLVKSYNGQKYESARFDKASNENTRLATKYERVASLQGPIYHIVIACSLGLILFLILLFWQDSAGSAIAYLTAAGMIAKPIRQLSSVNETIQKGLAASETIFEVLDMAKEQSQDQSNKKLSVSGGSVSFNQVSFSYGDKRAVNNINLTIEPGQTVALVGQSGSGKSTLVSLLLRFYEPESGAILIDGQPISEIALSSLRSQIAFVNQQTTLFNDTIAANIAYGEDVQLDKDGLIAAAKSANAFDFIEQQTQGFETSIGEAGDRLSGGQRQRLAVARALYKDAPILVLDEATSALDNESEKLIQEALETLQEGRTTIVIAHRLSTIENADVIVAMQNGEITEVGNHKTLLEKGGYYASLYATQFSE
ncbi:lipid A export permease/ATP-binding protein MsbA [Marinagarivorans cellulosilyticus]|uniref:ATP-binding cassette, subfamily B, bacterial MsbA n=1 Tax=Marinagarivorans cellulosilyticus TaxID=2721545 RepID=A0AAN2BL75_9GAMM|nr:lipid A export permease/ATP-binding protein MsbA [Marinagarivorans cellulosilyticus]BCD98794.1 ATP-binding cassette, subfamily B, bacterial MsbA [Marinagarivorans cellulosilyticus]